MASGYALRHLAHQGNANLQNFQDLTALAVNWLKEPLKKGTSYRSLVAKQKSVVELLQREKFGPQALLQNGPIHTGLTSLPGGRFRASDVHPLRAQTRQNTTEIPRVSEVKAW